MRSCADDEEAAPMVPPPPPPPAHDVPCKVVDGAAAPASSKPWWKTALLSPTRGALISGLLFLALLVGTRWIHLHAAWPLGGWMDIDQYSLLPGTGNNGGVAGVSRRRTPSSPLIPIPFHCGNHTSLCRRGVSVPPPAASPEQQLHTTTSPPPPPPRCPDYFRYIHRDLEPWRAHGITREAVERGRPHAHFRLTVVGGRAYVETYHRAFQTRDVFTQWGILQLLSRYPGRVPDLDLMFNCEDMPELRRADFPDPSAAPPLFRYCNDGATLDLLFPDWSFWGWPEINIRPWAPLMEDILRHNARLPWPDREPYAFWKGNPGVSAVRRDLLRCNNDTAAGKEWNARLFPQDWHAAIRNGFRDSDLAEQCRYRYKIYVQGRSWSVSEKYILACDSPMLAVATPYNDFFSRGLVAGTHYWPIDPARKCRAIKFAVDWGNAHPAQARRMGEEGSGFAREEMSMEYVYDYMLHVLTQYAALLRYTPTVPEKAVELCAESMACPAQGRDREFMMESRERYVAGYEPCVLPPALSVEESRERAEREREVRAKVHRMEDGT